MYKNKVLYTKENVIPRNSKGEPHGYAIYYFTNGDVSYEGEHIHGKMTGLWYWYEYHDTVNNKGHHITDKHYII